MTSWTFSADERIQYDRDGYVVREGVFDDAEVGELRDLAEQVIAGVVEHAERPDAGPHLTMGDGHRLQFSSRTVIQWEWATGSREVRLIEPFTHLHPRFDQLWHDRRLVDPMQSALGVDAVAYRAALELLATGRYPFADLPRRVVGLHDVAELLTDMAGVGNPPPVHGVVAP